MASSLLPEAELQQEFSRRRTRQVILIVPIFLSIFAIRSLDKTGPGWFGLPHEAIGIGAFAIIIGALIFSLYNWRCPSCSKYLGRGWSPKFCQKCGFRLQP